MTKKRGDSHFDTVAQYVAHFGFTVEKIEGDRPYRIKDTSGEQRCFKTLREAGVVARNDLEAVHEKVWGPRRANLISSQLSFTEWADLVLDLYRSLQPLVTAHRPDDETADEHFVSIEVRRKDFDAAARAVERVKDLTEPGPELGE